MTTVPCSVPPACKPPVIQLTFKREERMTPQALREAFAAVHITDTERWFDPDRQEWVTVVLLAELPKVRE